MRFGKRNELPPTATSRPRPASGNPLFGGERTDRDEQFPSAELRLLALFRYWNVIHYFFPYKHGLDGDWNAVLDTFVPRMLEAKDAGEYHFAIKELTTTIHDGHGYVSSDVLAQTMGLRLANVKIRLVEGRSVVSGRYRDDLTWGALEIGDVLLKLDDEPVEEHRARLHQLAHGSNEAGKALFVNQNLVRTTKPALELLIARQSSQETIEVPTYALAELGRRQAEAPEPPYRVLRGGIGYVDMALLGASDIADAMALLSQTPGIVFDMRAYPKFILYELLPYLLPESKPFARFSVPDLRYPGAFRWRSGSEVGPLEPDGSHYTGKIVVLVDETTISRAEFFTMALQTVPGARVVGSQTAGADGNVSTLPLPGKIETGFSGIGVFYPDGRPTQRVGIVPDVVVRPTIEGIRQGRDEVLEQALDLLAADPE